MKPGGGAGVRPVDLPPRPVLGRLFLLLLLVPLTDLMLLVGVGGRLGLVPTLGLVLLTAAAGSWLARREGLRAWTRVRDRLRTGALPGDELLDGLIVFAAGVLLLAPGFLTDVVGLDGLFPPSRRWLRRTLARRVSRGPGELDATPRPTPETEVEDADVVSETVRHKVASARL